MIFKRKIIPVVLSSMILGTMIPPTLGNAETLGTKSVSTLKDSNQTN